MKNMKVVPKLVVGVLLFVSVTNLIALEKKEVTIINNSSDKLYVYAANQKGIAQIRPGSYKTIKLPVKWTNRGGSYASNRTYQLMVVGGGVWETNRSGWTTLRRVKSCASNDFYRNTNKSIRWTITGNTKRCNGPRGYRQPGY